MCSVFNLNSSTDNRDGNLPVSISLSEHKGYVSCCQYVPDEDIHIITSSGDQTCVLRDITTGLRTSVFGGEFQSGHTGDVLSRAVRTFQGHEGDVNSVKFFPDGNRFGTGSDDGTCRFGGHRTAI
ncbi:hypothetical protein V6N12_041858 [Hibiscus sabdariffa]|uniref:Uncharacterized protein n=1 Tax=Hibiscus sabdariffa TaxID=183260 RepID=A0ABR2ED33_9ROSI